MLMIVVRVQNSPTGSASCTRSLASLEN